MPITCPIPLRRLGRQEFGELSYDVMREVFAIHHELGRFFVLRPAAVILDGVTLGKQPFRHAGDDVAFKLTAFEDREALDRFMTHSQRLLDHTTLRALASINIARQQITFSTLERTGRKMGAGK